jgi:dethiobiotin synthase
VTRTGYFVTGTNTGVGKTTFCRDVIRRHPEVTYWKPVQTGWPEDCDTRTVAAPHALPGLRFRKSVSPHIAAAAEGRRLTLEEMLRPLAGHEGPLLVEGAGGLLVPLAPGLLQTDLVAAVGLPAIVVARDELGVINHTLLTLEALRARDLPVHGVALVPGPEGRGPPGNRESIEAYGAVALIEDLF